MADRYIDQLDARNMDKVQAFLEDMPDYVHHYIAEKYAYHTKPSTLAAYLNDLAVFFAYFSKHLQKAPVDITVADLAAIKRREHVDFISWVRMTGGKNKKDMDQAVRRYQTSVSGLYDYLIQSGDYEGIDANIPKSIPRPKIARNETIDTFTDSDVDLIRASVEHHEGLSKKQSDYYAQHYQRDNMTITLLLTTGMRVSEIVGINLGDFRKDFKELLITRKERTQQVIFLSDEAAEAVREYIEGERAELLKLAAQIARPMLQDCKDPLILTVRKGYAGRISVRSVERLAKAHASLTDSWKKSPHSYRRTYGSYIYHTTGNIGLAAELLGHSDPSVTASAYASKDIERQKASAGLVKFKNRK